MADTTETKPDPTTTTTSAEETTPAPAVEKTEGEEKSVTEKATDAAVSAATKATDNVFSMFGGGPKKEKKEEVDDADEPSGSSKAKAGEEVSLPTGFMRLKCEPCVECMLTVFFFLREKRRSSLLKSTLSPSFTSPRKSRPRPTRSWKNRPLRCVQSFSSLTASLVSGRSVVLVTSDF